MLDIRKERLSGASAADESEVAVVEAELQLRLAGFRSTVPDGEFGPGTERQVMSFQQDFMRVTPSGVVDRATMHAIDRFTRRYPIDFKRLKCPCGDCAGFGMKRFKGRYVPGKLKVEAFHLYEYPGVHRMLLWAVRAVLLYLPQHKFEISSGYRCSVDNKQHGRSSTNHHGKAIDLDVPLAAGESKRDDMVKCDAPAARSSRARTRRSAGARPTARRLSRRTSRRPGCTATCAATRLSTSATRWEGVVPGCYSHQLAVQPTRQHRTDSCGYSRGRGRLPNGPFAKVVEVEVFSA
jgi:hypothetical protein